MGRDEKAIIVVPTTAGGGFEFVKLSTGFSIKMSTVGGGCITTVNGGAGISVGGPSYTSVTAFLHGGPWGPGLRTETGTAEKVRPGIVG